MSYGGQAAGELWQAASSGKFTLTEGAAHECAAHYQWFADQMAALQQQVSLLTKLAGFGENPSAAALQAGFQGKAGQAFEAFKSAEESALRMKAAILLAAGLTKEVEAATAAAIQVASREVSNVEA